MAISYANMSTEDIYMDTENADAHIKKVKNCLNRINDDLSSLKRIYNELLNDSKTKGKIRTQAQNIVNNCAKYIRANEAVKVSLERQLAKSAAEYVQALNAFDELGAYAEDLGNE